MRAMFIKALMLVRSVGRVVRLSCISESEISRGSTVLCFY